MRPKMRAYSHQGHGPRADQTGRIHISDFRYQSLLRNAAGPYIGATSQHSAALQPPRTGCASSSTIRTLLVWLHIHRNIEFYKVTIWTTQCFNGRSKLHSGIFDDARTKPSPIFISRGTLAAVAHRQDRISVLGLQDDSIWWSTVFYRIGKEFVDRQSEGDSHIGGYVHRRDINFDVVCASESVCDVTAKGGEERTKGDNPDIASAIKLLVYRGDGKNARACILQRFDRLLVLGVAALEIQNA